MRARPNFVIAHAKIVRLTTSGPLVVVHGGGRAIDAELRARGQEPRFVDGLRVTDPAALDAVVCVLAGRNNTALVASIGAAGGRAVGLTGADGFIGRSTLAGSFTAASGEPVNLGLVGQPDATDVSLLSDLLGLELSAIEEVPGEKVRVALLPAGRTRIELVEPAGHGSTVARFLEKRGEGVHHVCFEVADLTATLARFSRAGIEVTGSGDRPGAEGSRIAFIHPRSTGGVLIELRQSAGKEMKGRPEGGPSPTDGGADYFPPRSSLQMPCECVAA